MPCSSFWLDCDLIFVFITFRQRYSSLLLDFHEDLVQSLHKLVDLLFLDPDGRGRRQVRSGQRVAVGAPTCVVTRVCFIALSEKTQTTDLSANKYTSINTTQVKITVKKVIKKTYSQLNLCPSTVLTAFPVNTLVPETPLVKSIEPISLTEEPSSSVGTGTLSRLMAE